MQEAAETRIVCISDTHNQTPKLPKGDVLIHAGDLTNQGSYSELKKTVEWLEKADFEAKIVVAGNHDLTLDTVFFEKHGSGWKWPNPQDPSTCRKLLLESKSITYLEHKAASIYLDSPEGPGTCFKVFGSPYSPKHGLWGFQYERGEASKLWNAIPLDTDIVVTHTPPAGHCDAATKDDRSGCELLLQALHRVRPMLSICGHIHEARGVEFVRWNGDTAEMGSPKECVEIWKDPGIGNKKQSLVNLTAKEGRRLDNYSLLTPAGTHFSLTSDALTLEPRGQSEKTTEDRELAVVGSTLPSQDDDENEARTAAVCKGAFAQGQDAARSEIGLTVAEQRRARRETVMINAAYLGPRIAGGSIHFNKPIGVDLELPVWRFEA
ncbi:calcineurin-like phosphoesterase [Westerdykella ornata]|uniref:Calcineurin-like phosphoesterase n=1 Tax=Westerdykella ornata TaxID=318751 RepID=A0A6A6JEQ7_WESOR|nr:calcineurin-like phosphoesterase [Westerdykella ornata]KAF2275100.1 calcineurin-like phosphoesterase [Westerdykella ornata]